MKTPRVYLAQTHLAIQPDEGDLIAELSATLRGHDGLQLEVSCAGQGDRSFDAVRLSCTGPDQGVLKLSDERLVARARGLSVNADIFARTGSLTLTDIDIHRSDLSARLSRIELGVDDKLSASLSAGQLRLNEPKTEESSTPRSRPQLVRRLTAVLEKQQARWSWIRPLIVRFKHVEWEAMDVVIPQLPRITGFSGHVTDNAIDMSAVVASGQIKIEADWGGDYASLRHLAVELDGLRLSPLFAPRLPAIAPGRTKQGRVDGQISGKLRLVSPSDDLFTSGLVNGDVHWAEGSIDLRSVSDEPVFGLEIRSDWSGQYHLQRGQLSFDSTLSLGRLQATIQGRVDDALDDPIININLSGQKLPCEEALAELPAGLLGPYERVAAGGVFAPRLTMHWPVHRPTELRLRFDGMIRNCEIEGLNAHPRAYPDAELTPGDATPFDDVTWLTRPFRIQVREGVTQDAPIWVGPTVPGYVPLAELPEYVGAAAFLSEEINFFKNRPIDPGLIARAFRLNFKHGRFVYGGSTVTQQLVKNLFLRRAKTLSRKIQEILIAARITQTVSRERVLELYLNCIEFGPNVFGIGAAAQYYFQKNARDLTPREAVFLAMLKPAPRFGANMRRRGRTPKTPYWGDRAEEIMRRLVEKGYLTQRLADADRPYAIRWVDEVYQPRKL